jgi:hypothetical protein
MKLIKLLTLGAMIGAITLGINKAEAFPLKLNSCSGFIKATPSYSAISGPTNKAHYVTKTFNLKTVTMLLSNTLVMLGSNTPPADAYIAYDQYDDITYFTNKTGYYQRVDNLANNNYYVSLSLEDMAAAWTISSSGNISENDPYDMFMGFDLLGPDGGEYYAAANYGIGNIHYSTTSSSASMTMTGGRGADYGEIDDSYDGASELNFNFSGSTTSPDWDGPFWLWWE